MSSNPWLWKSDWSCKRPPIQSQISKLYLRFKIEKIIHFWVPSVVCGQNWQQLTNTSTVANNGQVATLDTHRSNHFFPTNYLSIKIVFEIQSWKNNISRGPSCRLWTKQVATHQYIHCCQQWTSSNNGHSQLQSLFPDELFKFQNCVDTQSWKNNIPRVPSCRLINFHFKKCLWTKLAATLDSNSFVLPLRNSNSGSNNG